MKTKKLKSLLQILKLIAEPGAVFETDSLCTQIKYMGGCKGPGCGNCPFVSPESLSELISEIEGVDA